mmetsp:Transcript_129952/g.224673  ORF Transcript_129952/g.224673 Transcript_129952/m.224673 type:complete len:86 (-) Transcript_129952:38-295(-)
MVDSLALLDPLPQLSTQGLQQKYHGRVYLLVAGRPAKQIFTLSTGIVQRKDHFPGLQCEICWSRNFIYFEPKECIAKLPSGSLAV